MRWGIVAAVLVAGPLAAEEWEPLAGAALQAALAARTLVYADGARQDFGADGTTLYDAGQPQAGRWQVQGRQYCSLWPPSDSWSCYDVARRGAELRFTGRDGTQSLGRYAGGE